MKFLARPITIDAIQVTQAIKAATDDWAKAPDWLRMAWGHKNVLILPRAVHINTLSGWLVGSPGDWIIRGVHGDIYPYKPDIFAAMYEPIPDVSRQSTCSADMSNGSTYYADVGGEEKAE